MELFHPYHPHKVRREDMETLYHMYDGKWKCDVCKKSYDGRCNDATQRYAYHCTQCSPPDYFDICTECFRGKLHPFHHHRLKRSKTSLCYPQSDGNWRCDACKSVAAGSEEKICYHCERCEIDLCSACAEGEQYNRLHGDGKHCLLPIDPRIRYRCYEEWSCGVCDKRKTHDLQMWLLFRCEICDEDICYSCYQGESHQLHQHGMVPCLTLRIKDETCSVCSKKITKDGYACHLPQCIYFLCSDCYHSPVKYHSSHPQHVLYCTEFRDVYLHSQDPGILQCDNFTCNRPLNKPTLQSTKLIYHCSICQYNLCEKCFDEEFEKNNSRGTSQRTFVLSTDQYQIPQPFVNYIPSKPTFKLCRVCGLSSAKLTAVHDGRPHGELLYCKDCGDNVIRERKPCCICGKTVDNLK